MFYTSGSEVKFFSSPKRPIVLQAFSTCFVVKAHNSERNSYNESLLDTVLMVSSETPRDANAFMGTIEIIEGGSARTVDTPCKHVELIMVNAPM